MAKAQRRIAACLLIFCAIVPAATTAAVDDAEANRKAALFDLLQGSSTERLGAFERLAANWHDHLTPAVLEFISLTRSPTLQLRAFDLLREQTHRDLGYDLNDWFAWAWEQNLEQPAYYADFKSHLYRQIDRRFGGYFDAERDSAIRLDEIRWGGVVQDGIPPLRDPQMIAAADAAYLDDNNVVFGIEVNGDYRAYPKRILAWHEMFVDDVGGVSVAGVYCTLCGSVILYETTVDGVAHQLGTSGFLYRSNKLMYDKATQSLWNTMWGTPAVGPLVDQSIRLPRRTVVTTTWGEWRRRHPETMVLSLKTGYQRDYGEGVAYRDYFATDELMFNTSQVDNRLANKAEVLGLVFADSDARPLAISAEYATERGLLSERIGEREFVVTADKSGALRVYESQGIEFASFDGDVTLNDAAGTTWRLHEDSLRSANGDRLARLPSHNAFWFGWYGAYPHTRLLH